MFPQPIPTNVDWSATAAWIALAISIVGTIASPIITTILTNRYNLKLHKLTFKEQQAERKEQIIQDCISAIGSCTGLSYSTVMTECGKVFFNVYAYVPKSEWDNLDRFFNALSTSNMEQIHALRPSIIHMLSSILVSLR